MSSGRFRTISLSAMLAMAIFVTACGKKEPPATPAPPPPPPPPPPAPAPTEAELFARMTLEQLNAQQPLELVHFAYDSSDLDDTARASLQKNATWLQRWTSTRVTVEGHADSRGTSEYNLALGERRAASVRDYLASLGVEAARMATVSLGEERPLCSEETETCWAQNRRGQFVITAK